MSVSQGMQIGKERKHHLCLNPFAFLTHMNIATGLYSEQNHSPKLTPFLIQSLCSYKTLARLAPLQIL